MQPNSATEARAFSERNDCSSRMNSSVKRSVHSRYICEGRRCGGPVLTNDKHPKGMLDENDLVPEMYIIALINQFACKTRRSLR